MAIHGVRGEVRSWTILRGFAALAVVLFHFRPHVNGNLGIPILGPVIEHGDLGVDLFFVLSGLVMHTVYGAARRADGFTYRSFMVRRLARVYPVHFVTTVGAIAMFVIGGLAGLSPFDGSTLAWAVPVHLLLLHGLGPIQNAMALNFPSWSISAEMFAYLCFPAFALLYRGSQWRAVTLLSLTVIALLIAAGTDWIQIGAFRVSAEFLVGMGVGRLLHGRTSPISGAALLVAGTALYAACLAWDPFSGWVIIGFAMILAGCFLAEPLLGRGRLVGALTYVGRISFSIYMIHALVMSPGFIGAEKLLGVAPDESPMLLVVTVTGAAMLYHLIEEPCRARIVKAFDRLKPRSELVPTPAPVAAHAHHLRRVGPVVPKL